MISLQLAKAERLLVLGAHCDDVEIGCGGTLLHLIERHPALEVRWVTFSGDRQRQGETARSAEAFLAHAAERRYDVYDFRDGYFPWAGDAIKDRFEEIAAEYRPDIVLTHYRDDRHQDHRVVAELTWNTFRNQLVLEYEIPKWDGDLGRPNVYVPLPESVCRLKIANLMEFYRSQRSRDWFTEDLFWGLMRIRGVECRSPSGFAEAFYGHKVAIEG